MKKILQQLRYYSLAILSASLICVFGVVFFAKSSSVVTTIGEDVETNNVTVTSTTTTKSLIATQQIIVGTSTSPYSGGLHIVSAAGGIRVNSDGSLTDYPIGMTLAGGDGSGTSWSRYLHPWGRENGRWINGSDFGKVPYSGMAESIAVNVSSLVIGTYYNSNTHPDPLDTAPIIFGQDNHEVMRISSEGSLLIGTTTESTAGSAKIFINGGDLEENGNIRIFDRDQNSYLILQNSGGTMDDAIHFINSDQEHNYFIGQRTDGGIMEFVDMNDVGAYFNGNVGFGVMEISGETPPMPQATVDIDGYMRLAPQTSAPAVCSGVNDGAIALTSLYSACVCNGNSWQKLEDVTQACVWQAD